MQPGIQEGAFKALEFHWCLHGDLKLTKCLATLRELESGPYRTFLRRLNEIAVKCRLKEYTTYSRIWEYPWLWFQLEPLKGKHLRVVDIGSEMSPFPWFLATQGFDVIVSDMKANCWRVWQRARRALRVTARRRILDAQSLDLPTASLDIYLSVSVIEHVPDKGRVILEAARVLRPGGLLVMTFDICEPDMDMTFPEWNGRALTMSAFDNLFRDSDWFEPGLREIPWNVDDIPEYLSWHRTTAPWHNYVTGAAVLRRNQQTWVEPAWKGTFRSIRGNAFAAYHLVSCPFHLAAKAALRGAGKIFRKTVSFARRTLSLFTTYLVHLIGELFFSRWGRCSGRAEIDVLQVKHVLIVRLDGIGDVVLTTPFLRELRRNLPDAWITLVVKPAVYNLVERCPYVNEVLTYDWSGYKPLKRLQRHLRALQLAWKHLWRRRFGLAILPRWDVDYYHGTFVVYFSGAPWRVGYSENVIASKKKLNQGFDRLLTHVLDDSGVRHEVEHNLDVIRFLGGEVQEDRLELWVGDEDQAFADEVLRNYGVKSGDLLVGLGPGTGAPKRQWPIDCYVELGFWLQHQYDARLLIVGGSGEEILARELQQKLGSWAINAVGKTTLRQAAALIKRTSLYVGNDAGPMHIAAAVGVSVVELSCHPKSGSPYSPNSPQRFGPWGESHVVIQPETSLPPCTDECIADGPHCILGITMEQVKQVVSQIFYGRRVIEGHRIGCGRDPGRVRNL